VTDRRPTAEEELYRAQRARPERRRARLLAFRAQVLAETADEIRPCCGDCATVLDVLAKAAAGQADPAA
jgi:hypothetical protein